MQQIQIKIDEESIKQQITINVPERIEIFSQEQYNLANEALKYIKDRYKDLEEQRKKLTKPLDDAKKQIMDLFRPYITKLEEAEKKIKSAIIEYNKKLELKALEEAERIRKELEAKRLQEAKKLEAKLQKASENNNEEKVKELENKIQELNTTPIVIPTITPAVEHKNVTFRVKWYAEVVDFSALPDEYKLPNQQALDKVAQATKGTIKIPGVVFKSEKIVVTK